MTRKDQIKILDDKIKANERQYDLDRINAEISSYSSGDLPKYEYLTKKDLGYKPDAVEKVKFEYSPIGKVFTDVLAKEDKSKKVGLLKRLKNIEDNLVEVDDNDNKVAIFRIIKDIKDKGIKIDNDDEAVREVRERIKELIDDGVKVNNFDEMKKEVIEHVKNLKEQGANLKVDEDQINDLINKIFDKKYLDLYNPKSSGDTIKKGEELKILTKKQMLNRLSILLAQIQAGNNSKSLKNELRQMLYSLYRSQVLTKTVYNNLIKSTRA